MPIHGLFSSAATVQNNRTVESSSSPLCQAAMPCASGSTSSIDTLSLVKIQALKGKQKDSTLPCATVDTAVHWIYAK
jgi:hypothetical protein